MTLDLIPLGTASAIPARGRHLSACVLARQGRLLLFDCGEGTQFQLARAGLKSTHLDAVFITHLHGDHLYGLPGLISTLALLEREAPLALVGPAGTEAFVRALPGLDGGRPGFPIRFTELDEAFGGGRVYETDAFTVEARPVDHRVFTVGYRFAERTRPGSLDVEKARALGVTDWRHYRALKAGEAVVLGDGRTVAPEAVVGPPRPGLVVAYVTDTRPCAGGVALAAGADLLYHEATFTEQHHERAVATGHSTAREAAEVARRAGAERLLIGHFSARYPDPAPLVAEARAVFQNTEAADELNRYVLRGA
ncbi:MAG: ribonuclease Z [Rhodothermales bacterium]|nr:ribonuclease Z [Rhodothermales bacterium]